MSNKIDIFIDTLIKDTLNNCLEWIYVDSLADEISQTSGVLPPELSGTECSDIDYHRAYACQTNAGAIYLLYTMVSLDNDAESWEGFQLFLHPSPYQLSKYFCLLQKSDKLYRLENAIRQKISNSVRSLNRNADYYLDLFLRARM